MTEESINKIEDRREKFPASQTQKLDPGMAVWHSKGSAPRRAEGREPRKERREKREERREKREERREKRAQERPPEIPK